MGLKPALPLVEARTIDAAASARFGDVPQRLIQLNRREALASDLLGGIFGCHSRKSLLHSVPRLFSRAKGFEMLGKNASYTIQR
jgi:hypothetical protein